MTNIHTNHGTTNLQLTNTHEIAVRPVAIQPEPLIATDATDRLIAQIEGEERCASRIKSTPVIGPRNQHMTVGDAEDEVHHIKMIISLDEDRIDEKQNSLRHRLAPRWLKLLALFMLIFVDYPIMFLMASSIFNVDWSDPFGIPLLISVVVATLSTGGAAAALHHLGHEHREHKNDKGQLEWRTLSKSSRATLIAVALLLLLIGWGSYQRIYTEGVLSGSNLAVLLALLVSFVLVISAWLIWRTAFRDGSVLTDDLARYSRIVNHYVALQRSHEDNAAKLRHQLNVVLRRAQRNAGTIPLQPPA
ncbi:MAG: hypothetical protein JWO67_1313 [Streptosporangiaceae bacterium]|nr:hypothetical protein [Streptosporangiaceae bacterium]